MSEEQLKAASDTDAVVAIAKAAGFVISPDDLKKAQTEVSDEELEAAAGGGIFSYAGCRTGMTCWKNDGVACKNPKYG